MLMMPAIMAGFASYSNYSPPFDMAFMTFVGLAALAPHIYDGLLPAAAFLFLICFNLKYK